jgi:hypothetical protein
MSTRLSIELNTGLMSWPTRFALPSPPRDMSASSRPSSRGASSSSSRPPSADDEWSQERHRQLREISIAKSIFKNIALSNSLEHGNLNEHAASCVSSACGLLASSSLANVLRLESTSLPSTVRDAIAELTGDERKDFLQTAARLITPLYRQERSQIRLGPDNIAPTLPPLKPATAEQPVMHLLCEICKFPLTGSHIMIETSASLAAGTNDRATIHLTCTCRLCGSENTITKRLKATAGNGDAIISACADYAGVKLSMEIAPAVGKGRKNYD